MEAGEHLDAVYGDVVEMMHHTVDAWLCDRATVFAWALPWLEESTFHESWFREHCPGTHPFHTMLNHALVSHGRRPCGLPEL